MANLVKLEQKYSDNLLNANSLLINNPTISYTGNGTLNLSDNNVLSKDGKSAYLYTTQTGTGLLEQFSLGNALTYNAVKDGIYGFQFSVLLKNISVPTDYTINLKLKLFINGILIETFENSFNIDTAKKEKFIKFAQTFNANEKDVIDFAFEIESDLVAGSPILNMFFSGFKLEIFDKDNYLPTDFSLPNDFYSKAKPYEVMGFWDYNDLGTHTSQIDLPANVWTAITNDGNGFFTNKDYGLSYIDDIYNTTTNLFDFSNLELGDVVNIRLDLNVTTTSANTSIDVDLVLGYNAIGEYRIPFLIEKEYKTSGADKRILSFNSIYMGDLNTKDNPSRFEIRPTSFCTLIVNGWYITVIKKNIK